MSNNIEFRVLISGAEQIGKQMSQVASQLEEFSKVTKNLGRELSQVGSVISVLGASISGPLVLAFNNSAKSSYNAATQVRKFKELVEKFQQDIARDLVPIFKKFNIVLTNLYAIFKNLDPVFRSQVIQGALLSGIFLTMSGVLTLIAGKVLSLISNLSGLASKFLIFVTIHPVIVAVGVALTILVGLMFKFKQVADVVLSTFQVLFLLLQNGFLSCKASLEEFTAVSLKNIANILSALAKIPGPQQELLQGFADNISNLSAIANRFAYEDMQAIVDKSREIGEIMTEGQGTWSLAFDDLKTKAQGFFNTLTGEDSGVSPVQTFSDGFSEALDQLKIKLTDMKAIGSDLANTLQSGLSTAFSNIILGAMSVKEAFNQFGQTMLKWLVNYVAEWLAFQIISKTVLAASTALGIASAVALAAAWAPAALAVSIATFGAAAAAGAAANTAAAVSFAGNMAFVSAAAAMPKFKTGSSGIKDDTVGLFNRGEVVIPTSFSEGLKSGELTLSGGGNSGGITIDFSNATFNGITESFVRDIFTKASEAINSRTLAPLPAV